MSKTKTTKSVKSETKIIEPKESKVSKNDYQFEVSVNDVVFKTKAESLEQALTEFVESPVYPVGAKTKLFFTYSKGDVNRKRLFQTPEARRMLTTLARKPSAITILAEQLTRSLNE
jgi:hypothetical protein